MIFVCAASKTAGGHSHSLIMMVAASIAHSGLVTYIALAFHVFYYTILAYFYIFLFQ